MKATLLCDALRMVICYIGHHMVWLCIRIVDRSMSARPVATYWEHTVLLTAWVIWEVVRIMQFQIASWQPWAGTLPMTALPSSPCSSARRTAVYSMFYNSHRLHSYLGYKNPSQYESETKILKKSLIGLSSFTWSGHFHSFLKKWIQV